MSLESEIGVAHADCPCTLPPWSVTKCRNCASSGRHVVETCEWRGHAAIARVVQLTRLDALERIKGLVDRDAAISVEVRKILQGA